MGIKELIGIESERKIRYAIVGLGDIAQEDMMPGVEHTGNSETSALITSDPVKADELGKKYGVAAVCGYEQFQEALTSGIFDAIWRRAQVLLRMHPQ